MANNIRRTIKNVVNNYSEVQVKVREATSNDPWGPSSTLMSEIADLTYNHLAFIEIMQMLWKRLNDHGKNWRHVYKSLVLLDYIIKTGSEKVAQQCKENIFAVQTLKDFVRNEESRDVGNSVREKAKQIVALLQDDERLKNERVKALKAKERLAQNAVAFGSNSQPQFLKSQSVKYESSAEMTYKSSDSTDAVPARVGVTSTDDLEHSRPKNMGEEQLQLEIALALSREEHEEQVRQQLSDERKLQLALEESRRSTDQPGSFSSSPSAANNLLDLSLGAPSTATFDPWSSQPPTVNAQPVGASRAATVDPWAPTAASAGAAAAAGAQARNVDPWSPPSTTTAAKPQPDPWTPHAAPGEPALTNPFHELQLTDDSNDDTSASTGLDPWQPTSGTRGAGDDFEGLHSTNGSLFSSMPSTMPPPSYSDSHANGNSGDVGGEQKSRKPEDFLGNHAKLVRLDNLLPTSAASASSTGADAKGLNPFAEPTNVVARSALQPRAGPASGSADNPFAASSNQNKVSINQMRQQQQNADGFQRVAGPFGESLLPAPLLPAPVSTNQPAATARNPFL